MFLPIIPCQDLVIDGLEFIASRLVVSASWLVFLNYLHPFIEDIKYLRVPQSFPMAHFA